MHIAAELAKIDVVEMLLKAGFDLTIQDKVRISRANIVLLEQMNLQQHNEQTCKKYNKLTLNVFFFFL